MYLKNVFKKVSSQHTKKMSYIFEIVLRISYRSLFPVCSIHLENYK